MGGVMKKITLSFKVLATIIVATILQACAEHGGPYAVCVQDADADALKRERSGGEHHHGHVSDGDDGG